jgi:TPR repeat protein
MMVLLCRVRMKVHNDNRWHSGSMLRAGRRGIERFRRALCVSRAFLSGGSLLTAAEAYDAASGIIARAQRGETQLDEALPLLQHASAMGSLEASGRLGRWFLFGLGGAPKDVDRALEHLLRAAQGGDPEAQFWLAKAILEHSQSGSVLPSTSVVSGSPGVEEDERVRLERAAQVLKEIRAMQRANKRRQRAVQRPPAGLPLPGVRDVGLAERWLTEAASVGHVPSMVALGNVCLHEAPARPLQAIEWYQASCGWQEHWAPDDCSVEDEARMVVEAIQDHHPSTDGLFNLGLIWHDGIREVGTECGSSEKCESSERRFLVVPRPPAAAVCFLAGATLGDASCQFWMGYSYHQGDAAAGIDRDSASAVRWLERAGESGHGGALHYLSLMHRSRDEALGVADLVAASDASTSEAVANALLTRAAEANHGPALLQLGQFLARGEEGFEQNARAAMEAFLRAGEQGEAGGFASAGALVYSGMGGSEPPNFVHALALYQRAADMGDLDAWRNIADMYERGQGVSQSAAHARYIREHVLHE